MHPNALLARVVQNQMLKEIYVLNVLQVTSQLLTLIVKNVRWDLFQSLLGLVAVIYAQLVMKQVRITHFVILVTLVHFPVMVKTVRFVSLDM